MPKTKNAYPEEFRQRLLALVRAGRTPEELAREFEPTARLIRDWVAEAGDATGHQTASLTPVDRDLASPWDNRRTTEPPANAIDQTEKDYRSPAGGAEGWTLDLRHYVWVLWKRRWAALAAFLTVLAYAVVANNMAVPVYRASARVVVEPDRLNPVFGEDWWGVTRSMETELAILGSRRLAKRTVAALGLPMSAGPADDGEGAGWGVTVPSDPSMWDRIWLSLRSLSATSFGIGAPPPLPHRRDQGAGPETFDGPAALETRTEARQIDSFLAGLSVSYPDGSGGAVIDLAYQASDPEVAASFVNAHAQAYIDHSIERRSTAVDELTTWLAESVAAQRERVDTSEASLARFREANALTTIDGASPTVVRLNELAASLTRTQAQRLEEEADYNQALALRSDVIRFDRLLAETDPTLQSRQVQLEQLRLKRSELSTTLRERHPDMVALQEEVRTLEDRLEDDRDRLLEQLLQAVVTSQVTEARVTEVLDRLESEAVEQDRKGVQLSGLTREAESNREIYDLLVERAQENDVSRERVPVRARVLDLAAVPTAAVSLDRQRTFLRGIGGGLLLAIAVVFGLERLDNRVRTPQDLQTSLDLPLIGLLPKVAMKDQDGPLLAMNGQLPQFAEELRHVRTSVTFSFSGDAPGSLVVTSATPNEGKTVVASNLAVALAQAGRRVLLIDADMRRPRVDLTLGLSPGQGLSNLLIGQAKLTEVIQETRVDNLWALPAGHPPPNPSELLGSPTFRSFLGEMEQHFSWIIIDTPPVIAVTDACVISDIASGVLFVVGSERVSRRVAALAVAQLRQARGRLIGGVLNYVAIGRRRQYYGADAASYYAGYYAQHATARPPATEVERS